MLKDRSPECQLLEGRDYMLLNSAAQCPGYARLDTVGSVNVGQSEMNSGNFHPPTGVKTIPWDRIANQIVTPLC